MASAEKHLGNLGGISVTGRMEDETIGAQQTTTYTLSITNTDASDGDLTNVKVEVEKIEPKGKALAVHPPHVFIPVLERGETEHRVFLVHNTTNEVVTTYILQNRISYAEEVHEFANFTRP